MDILVQSMVQGLVFGGIYSIAALGFALIYFTIKVFHVAYGGILTVGTYIAAVIATGSGLGSLTVGLITGIMVAAITSVAVYIFIYRPMSRGGATNLQLFVVSLGLNLAIVAIILIVFGPLTRNFNYPQLLRLHSIGAVQVSWLGLASVVLAALALLGVKLFTTRTPLGKQMRAVGANPELADLRGVRSQVVIAVVFAIGAALSVVAGTLLGISTSVTSDAGTNLALLVAIATLLGGTGSYTGAYLGGLIVGMLGGVTSALLPGQWSTAVVFAAFIIIVLLRPDGLIRVRVLQ